MGLAALMRRGDRQSEIYHDHGWHRGISFASMINGLSSSGWRQMRGNITSSLVKGSKSGVARLHFHNTTLAVGGMRVVGVGHGVNDGN